MSDTASEAGSPPRLFRLLDNLLEWSTVDKSMLMLGILLPMLLQYFLWLVYALSLPDREQLVDVEFAYAQFPVFGAIAAGVAILLGLGMFLRLRVPNSRAFETVVLFYSSGSLLYCGWLVGPFTVETGVVLVGGLMIGLMLFNLRVVIACWAYTAVTLLGMLIQVGRGEMAFAPLVIQPTADDTTHQWFWIATHLAWTVSYLLFTIVVAGFALWRWRQREDAFRRLSHTDALTAVHNRRSILRHLEREVARVGRSGGQVSVLLADLDHFKSINDTWGHPVGDQVLRGAAAALKSALREYDVVGRYGGEEFLVVLPDTALETGLLVAERCRERLQALEVHAHDNARVPVRGSFGLACSSQFSGNASAEMLIHQADEALYRAKQNGRNRVETG